MLELSAASDEMDSDVACCCEKDSYQRQLSLLFADIRHLLEVPTIVSTDVLVLSNDVRYLC